MTASETRTVSLLRQCLGRAYEPTDADVAGYLAKYPDTYLDDADLRAAMELGRLRAMIHEARSVLEVSQ